MSWLSPTVLKGRHASLLPLAPEHAADLAAALRDGNLWELWYTNIPHPDDLAAEIARRLALLAQGSMLPFVVLDAAGTIVGMTNFLNLDAVHRRLEIGATWYAGRAQRSAVNTECKFMLLQHAFETLECIAVEFRTHRLNRASRQAIERLGAQLDGILRNHQRSRDGTLRDTCVYSIVDREWPTVKTHLQWQLHRPRG